MGSKKSPLKKKTQKDDNVNRQGTSLLAWLKELSNLSTGQWTHGERVWVKAPGYCDWPGVVWNLEYCLKRIIPDLVNTYTSGSILVRFYGDHTSMWCPRSTLKPIKESYERLCTAMKKWSKKDKKRETKANRAFEELETSSADCQHELQRMLQLQSNSLSVVEGSSSFTCTLCEEDEARLKCRVCDRHFHPLCLTPAALTASDLPHGGHWLCPFCGEENHAANDSLIGEEEKIERMGLTPDWIIHAGAFNVFQLEEPTKDYPYIRGLLDPCTNSKVAPNIPAEVIYDKNDDGLKRCNPWEGYYIVLNPDFKAQIQWRFVNRAIDEVENDRVPGVLLICRNSTDTAYFQRLMPYPRVLLRRNSIRFKDYDKTPIGFGIVVFCIVKNQFDTIITRFLEQFAPYGEPNIVMDKEWLQSYSFETLLKRLYKYANEHHRDHWVQCCRCGKWRIISYQTFLVAQDSDWECKHLNPPFTSCRTNQTKAESMGARYAALSEEKPNLNGHQQINAEEPRFVKNEINCLEACRQVPIDYSPGVGVHQIIKMEDAHNVVKNESSNGLEKSTNRHILLDNISSLTHYKNFKMEGEEIARNKINSLCATSQVKIDLDQARHCFNSSTDHLVQAQGSSSDPPSSTINTQQIQGGKFYVKILAVDNAIFQELLQRIHQECAMPVAPQLEDTPEPKALETPKKEHEEDMISNLRISNGTPTSEQHRRERTTSLGKKRDCNGEVKSALEMSREANKAAIQSYFDNIVVHRAGDDDSQTSLYEAQIQEANRAVQHAREQVTDALQKETQIRSERLQLEAIVHQKREEFEQEEREAEQFLTMQQERMLKIKSSVDCR